MHGTAESGELRAKPVEQIAWRAGGLSLKRTGMLEMRARQERVSERRAKRASHLGAFVGGHARASPGPGG